MPFWRYAAGDPKQGSRALPRLDPTRQVGPPPEPASLSVITLTSIAVQPKPRREGDRPGPTVQAAEAFRGRFPAAS
jgi:hypothetical protein